MKEVIISTASLITAVGIITGVLKIWLKKEMDDLKVTINRMDYSNCKTYLTDFLTEIEQGIPKSEIQRQRACEIYRHYIDDLDGNTYVQDKWEKLMK